MAAGRYDEWLAREPDPDRDRVRLEPETVWSCSDCDEEILVGAVSVPIGDGASRIYCRPCAEARRAAGWLFDGRSLAALRRSA